MRISDWSSDVCSSDLQRAGAGCGYAENRPPNPPGSPDPRTAPPRCHAGWPRGRVSFGIAPVIVSLLIVDAEHFEAPAQSDCPVNPVQHHIFIAHIEGGDGFRSIRFDVDESRKLTRMWYAWKDVERGMN